MTQEQQIQWLMFSGGFVGIVATFLAALPSIQDETKVVIAAAVTAVTGLINLALFVFFKVKQPITAAYNRGASDAAQK